MRIRSNAARAEEKRRRQLDDLRRGCPLVAVDAVFSAKPEGWTITGVRGGDTIINARAASLTGAAAKFREAYGLLVMAEAFKRLMTEAQ